MADVAEKFETEETVEKVEKLRSGEGQEEMAGVGEIEGDGDPERNISGEAPGSLSWSSMSCDVVYSNVSKNYVYRSGYKYRYISIKGIDLDFKATRTWVTLPRRFRR